MKLFDENVTKIFNISKAQSEKRGHLNVNTAAIFIAIVSTKPDLTDKKNEEKEKEYATFRNKVTQILLKYKIDGKEFGNAFSQLYPNGKTLPYESKIGFDQDMESVILQLKKNAQSKMQEQTINDLFVEALSDPTYSLYLVFNKISESRKENIKNKSEDEIKNSKAPFDPVKLIDDLIDNLGLAKINNCQLMDQFSPLVTNINTYVSEKNPMIFGFDKELLALEAALARKTKSAALIAGPAGTGKTSLVYKFAEAINKKQVPEEFKDVTIYELHLDAVLAGSMYRGQFEEKLMNILETAKALTPKNVILFIDEFHTITSAGGNTKGDVNASNILKPYITRGDISVIGASTNEEINSFVESDKAISRRFSKILLNEPTDEETEKIIDQLIPNYVEKYGKEISDSIKKEILRAASQYNIQVANPDRTISMLETVCSYVKIKYPERNEIISSDIYEAIAVSYNITATKNRFTETQNELTTKILGEEKALQEISQTLQLVEYNIVNPKKPKAVLLLAGPTGTGKTETAKIIAKYYTGSENNLVTVSGSSLMDKTSSSALFGTNAGYVGYQPTSTFLSQVKQNPNCVVLFDEIEKADKDIFRSLLQILDEGFVEDKIGNKISFRNAIIIFTTNLGFGTTAYSGQGIMATPTSNGSAIKEIKNYFSPEFLGRVNKIILYDRLSDAVAETLIERYRQKYIEYSGCKVEFDADAIKRIKESANISQLGARILEDCVRNEFLVQVEK